jgi:hypothetical protein
VEDSNRREAGQTVIRSSFAGFYKQKERITKNQNYPVCDSQRRTKTLLLYDGLTHH